VKSSCKFFFTAALLFIWAFAGCANHIPELLFVENKTVKTGELLEFEVNARDDDGDSLKFAASGQPFEKEARFDQIENNTAVFSWTPIASDAGPSGEGMEYQVTFKVTDGIDTSSEVITISVTLGGAGAGSPEFLTRWDYTLDLDRTGGQISFNIEVRDADSTNVTLRLVDDGGTGGEFSTSGSKGATFEWTPSKAQIGEKILWGIRVGAKDERNPEVFRNITILIKGGQDKCEGTSPTVMHKSLSEQRGSGDYPVQVTATDSESEISAVALYWLCDTGGGGDGSYRKSGMTSTGGDSWQGTIPNPGLSQGKTATIRYYICARDNDDPSGSECDLLSSVPEEGSFTFTAYSAGSSGCEDDDFESNDSSGRATEVTFDSRGEFYAGFLKICPANVDYYRINIPQNHEMFAGIKYTEANGMLQMDLLDSDGSTTLAAGQHYTDGVYVTLGVFSQGRDVYLRVEGGDAQVTNNYSLVVVEREFTQCIDDSFEEGGGNDTVNDAKFITPGTYPDLTSCDDNDFYEIDLNTGDKLEVSIEFVQEEADGDLDLWVFDEMAATADFIDCDNALGCGITETSDEEVIVGSILADGTYYIAVSPYGWVKNTYRMTVVVTPQTHECQDDADEDNDTPEYGTGIFTPRVKAGQVLCLNDEDWYFVNLDAGETLVVDLTFTHHADTDLDLKLYDSEVTPDVLFPHELASSITTSDNERIEFTAETQSVYNIRVYGYYQKQKATYSIGVRY
jgi:hypothetical protein